MKRYAVYVPVDPAGVSIAGVALNTIKRGSGIVGSAWQHDARQLVIDFEGNLYRASNVRTFADRVRQAWGRHSQEYPTVARMVVPAETLVQVAWYEPDDEEVDVLDRQTLAAWLDCDESDLDEELQTTRH